MIEILSLLIECRESGTLDPALQVRIDLTVQDILRGCDGLMRHVLEREFLNEDPEC